MYCTGTSPRLSVSYRLAKATVLPRHGKLTILAGSASSGSLGLLDSEFSEMTTGSN